MASVLPASEQRGAGAYKTGAGGALAYGQEHEPIQWLPGTGSDGKPRTQKEVEGSVNNVPPYRPAHVPFNTLHTDLRVLSKDGANRTHNRTQHRAVT